MELKEVTKTEIAFKEHPIERKYYETSDGCLFEINEKTKAKKHQKEIEELEEFKKTINYKKIDSKTLYDITKVENFYSFTFDSTIKNYYKYKHLFKKISRLSQQVDNNKKLISIEGRYLVLEHRVDGGDCDDYYDGYFGLLSDYINDIEKELSFFKNL